MVQGWFCTNVLVNKIKLQLIKSNGLFMGIKLKFLLMNLYQENRTWCVQCRDVFESSGLSNQCSTPTADMDQTVPYKRWSCLTENKCRIGHL